MSALFCKVSKWPRCFYLRRPVEEFQKERIEELRKINHNFIISAWTLSSRGHWLMFPDFIELPITMSGTGV
jgi:hypothetical protein